MGTCARSNYRQKHRESRLSSSLQARTHDHGMRLSSWKT
jgi:hypothetical protein